MGNGLSQFSFAWFNRGSVHQSMTVSQTSWASPGAKQTVSVNGLPVKRVLFSNPDQETASSTSESEESEEYKTAKPSPAPYTKYNWTEKRWEPSQVYSIIALPEDQLPKEQVCDVCGEKTKNARPRWRLKCVCKRCQDVVRRWTTWSEEDIVKSLPNNRARAVAFKITNRFRKQHNAAVKRKNVGLSEQGISKKRFHRGVSKQRPLLRIYKIQELGVNLDAR